MQTIFRVKCSLLDIVNLMLGKFHMEKSRGSEATGNWFHVENTIDVLV